MKVLYHHRTQGRGVEQVHIMGLVKALRELGHEVTVLSPPGVDVEVESEAADTKSGKAIFAFAANAAEFLFEFAEIVYNCIAYFRLNRILTAEKFDFIYERYALFGLAGILISGKNDIPLILEVNDATLVDRVRPLFLKRMASRFERYIFCKASTIITVSQEFKRIIVESGISVSKVHVQPNAIDAKRFAQELNGKRIRRKYNIGSDQQVIGFVGMAVQWHGLDMLFNQLDKIAQVSDSYILIVGDCSDIDITVPNGLEAHITFTGQVPHVRIPDYLDAMDLVVLPRSNDFGSPMKLFEYMASEAVVIAPRVGPVCEIIKDGVDGILFELDDNKDFARAVMEGLSLPHLEMRKKAKEKVFAHHTWTKSAQRLLKIRGQLKQSCAIIKNSGPQVADVDLRTDGVEC